MVSLKSEKELDQMRKAGAIVAQILDEMVRMVQPGISTGELDRYAESRCKDFKVLPAFKGYHGFPATVCISVNDEVVHGIPSPKRLLRAGDIVGLDFGVNSNGWCGDSARTVPVGKISDGAQKLLEVTQTSLQRGIEQCVDGNRVF